MNQDTVLVTGFAQVPRGTTLYEHYKTIGVVLLSITKRKLLKKLSLRLLLI
jgi:hypothetical protein